MCERKTDGACGGCRRVAGVAGGLVPGGLGLGGGEDPRRFVRPLANDGGPHQGGGPIWRHSRPTCHESKP